MIAPAPQQIKKISTKEEKVSPASTSKVRLTYIEKRDLEQLPAEIKALSKVIVELEQKLADPQLYQKNPAEFARLTQELADKKEHMDTMEIRWLELDEKVSAK